MNVLFIVGTRPQIIKSAPVIKLMEKHPDFNPSIIHTGQHYDHNLSGAFFKELGLPEPIYNCKIGGGQGVHHVAATMNSLGYAPFLRDDWDMIIVPGDTNSALAAALCASMKNYPIAHLEAGARSYNMNMVEESNRRIIDHLSQILFAPSVRCCENLAKENVSGEIHFVGDTLYDLFLSSCPTIYGDQMPDGPFILLTIHRAENTDNSINLRNILLGMGRLGEHVVFPAHPRTRKNIERYGLTVPQNINIVEPLLYNCFLSLVAASTLVVTDSGGIQKEAYWSKRPCVTIRDETEWVETINAGANRLCSPDPREIEKAVRQAIDQPSFQMNHIYGDGHASDKILEILRLVV